jgi:DNA-nicking Smr family endonuclease
MKSGKIYSSSEDTASAKASEDTDKKKEDKKDKVKTAKKIAKDMEKWAKTLNQRKEAAKASQPTVAAGASSSQQKLSKFYSWINTLARFVRQTFFYVVYNILFSYQSTMQALLL